MVLADGEDSPDGDVTPVDVILVANFILKCILDTVCVCCIHCDPLNSFTLSAICNNISSKFFEHIYFL